MIWCPNSGDECAHLSQPHPRSVLLMIGTPRNNGTLSAIESAVIGVFESEGYNVEIARNVARGSNILCKICELIQSIPIGVVVFTKDLEPKTVANIFYEAGLMHTLGKEVVFVGFDVRRPSDLDGIEWIHASDTEELERRLRERLEGMPERAADYNTLGEHHKDVENYEKAAEYFMKAVLLSGDASAASSLESLVPFLEEERTLWRLTEKAKLFLRFLHPAT